jgi:acetoacetate decarboxylase
MAASGSVLADLPYGMPPWHMAGRAIAIWLRLAQPEALRKRLPAILSVPEDPVIRLRLWDLAHDAGYGRTATMNDPEMTSFRELAFAVPVSYASLDGDFIKFIYADDPTYTAFGREVMGWPVRYGKIMIGKPLPRAPLTANQRFVGYLERNGARLVSVAATLLTPLDRSRYPLGLPVWLSAKSIPDATGTFPVVSQLVRSGPSEMNWGEIWDATATVKVESAARDDLSFLEPSEVIAAQYWSDLDLTIAEGEVLAEIPAEAAGG